MIKKGDVCRVKLDALEILPFNSKENEKWVVTRAWNDEICIQRMLNKDNLEELMYEVTEAMLIKIE